MFGFQLPGQQAGGDNKANDPFNLGDPFGDLGKSLGNIKLPEPPIKVEMPLTPPNPFGMFGESWVGVTAGRWLRLSGLG
jgi:hypothetical protein